MGTTTGNTLPDNTKVVKSGDSEKGKVASCTP